MSIFTFQTRYLLLALLIFLIELLIATFASGFIRTFFGDVLVVVLLYCLLRGFVNVSTKTAAIGVLVFAFGVEFAQYFKVVELLGLENNRIASIVIGRYFDWWDLLAYSVGIGMVLWWEGITAKTK